ncbi:MAG: tRNA 2-thiouridine(34) synthase MnmA [Paludibacteraceae bacterium]|nr:tRNA 2-thiouridine(34) synthase MnmA [Paludibacteraceae bacterium]
MSGGIDSTAAALLLREQGYHLIGCTFRTHYTSDAMLQSAIDLAARLGVEHHIVDYSDLFDDTVIRYFREEYMAGRTPNPCVLCNRTIKFGALMKEADRLGCDKIATGHYARVEDGYICRAADTRKDQTYFLWQLTPEQLNRVVFPLGNLTKLQVREYLHQQGFETLASTGESQDICFISDDYRSFLNLVPNPGKYILSDSIRPNPVSRPLTYCHQGYAHYTIGQRKGLGVALGKPAFVTHLDAEHNEVTLGTHDELYSHKVSLRNVVFRGDADVPVMAQIRYRSLPQLAQLRLGTLPTVDRQSTDSRINCELYFNDPVWAVTPGQSCVLYQQNRLVGGGIII